MANSTTAADGDGETRRDFLLLATTAAAGFGVAAVAWPFIDQMNPAADTLALGSIKVDISKVAVGQAITIKWRGRPVFIRHRTAAEIAQAKKDDTAADLKEPVPDAERAPKPEWLVMEGVCTHLGCIPVGQRTGEKKGDYGGWFCPCHGSHYDTSGRIRKGPAPANLLIPPYKFLENNQIQIG